MALFEIDNLIATKQDFKGVNYISAVVNVSDNKLLKTMAEAIRSKLKNTIVLLGSDISGKAGLVCAVSDDLKHKFKAGEIISKAAKFVQGGGGGAPHIATTGGKDSSKLQDAIDFLESHIHR